MTVAPGFLTLSQVKVCDLARKKQKAALFTNPLGKACYELDQERVRACLEELDRVRLLEAGLVYASEVRQGDRSLNGKEWRVFQAEVGCQPLHLACLACGQEVDRLLKEGANEKAKAVQVVAGDVVKLLLEYGARLDMADVGPMESTALHLAARFGAAKLLSQLLVLGADAQLPDAEGCTAELVARRSGQILCQEILQVVTSAEQKDLELLERPKRPRKARKAATKEASDGEHEEEEEEEETHVPGAKYVQGLWSMLNDLEQSSSESEVDAEERTQHLMAKLRERKEQREQQLLELAEEHGTVAADTEHLETLLVSLKERLETLKDRLARFDAGDHTAQEEIASERELCDFWEKRAKGSEELVNQLLAQRKRMRQEKSDMIHRLEKELKMHQRRAQGLESYWEQFFEADISGEVIDLLQAEQRCGQLEKELVKITSYSGALPTVFLDSRRLAPSAQLAVAARAYRRIHLAELAQKSKLNEMVEFCNGTIGEKERQLLQSLEEQLKEFKGAGEELSWATMALVIEQCRERLYAGAHDGWEES